MVKFVKMLIYFFEYVSFFLEGNGDWGGVGWGGRVFMVVVVNRF